MNDASGDRPCQRFGACVQAFHPQNAHRERSSAQRAMFGKNGFANRDQFAPLKQSIDNHVRYRRAPTSARLEYRDRRVDMGEIGAPGLEASHGPQ
jgi:hypothetical protein